MWIQETTEQAEASQNGARAKQPPLHQGDLEEDRPYTIIGYKKAKNGVKRQQILQKYSYKEIVKQRRAMIQHSTGYDNPEEEDEEDEATEGGQ